MEESKAGTLTDHALGCGSPLEALLRSFEVSPSDLLTDEVRGKLTLMHELEDLAKVWLVHEEERKAYERNPSFNWKKSTIATGLEEGNSLLKKLKDLVQNVASLKTPASVILTPAGSALTALAAACPVTKDSWEEARDNLAEAAVNSDEPLRPLTHKQLETCMELLLSRNATPVSTIMAMIGADGEEKSGSFYLSVLQQLLSLFPVMSVSRVTDQRCVLLNMNDFSLLARGDTFAEYFVFVRMLLCRSLYGRESHRL